jgi:hypothetical protein
MPEADAQGALSIMPEADAQGALLMDNCHLIDNE